MTIIEALVQLRNDLKLWVTNNLRVKMDKNLGTDNAGKVLAVDEEGNVVPVENTSGGGSEIDTIPTEGSENPISSGAMHTELKTVATAILGLRDNKMDKENPTGTGSFSLNRKADSNVGNFSVAEGHETEASGAASHAEGGMTKAKGAYAHAEGYDTEAAIYGHAEGLGTIAGQGSHAEGSYTNASGSWSHAEGALTESKGYQSHVEGACTIASSKSQHVQGEYNIEDVVNNPAARGKYAHIVGNGTASARSNAHTVAWDGTGWFAGDIYVGGTGQDDELATKVLTENDLSSITPNIEIDTIPTENSPNAISSGAMHKELKTVATAILGLREDKMDKENPTGTGAFSLNRAESYDIGDYSFAEGHNTIASSPCAHAEGENTHAASNCAHAEGEETYALGVRAHAEGYATQAKGDSSHAEGILSIVSNSATAAHAEGCSTQADGDHSHTEGNNTIASSKGQHVQGEYNIADTEGSASTRGKYAHIVGNGEYNDGVTTRSNAHTLDWSGNAWFAGDIYVGGTGQDDENAVKVLTENDLQEYAPAAEPFIITLING